MMPVQNDHEFWKRHYEHVEQLLNDHNIPEATNRVVTSREYYGGDVTGI